MVVKSLIFIMFIKDNVTNKPVKVEGEKSNNNKKKGQEELLYSVYIAFVNTLIKVKLIVFGMLGVYLKKWLKVSFSYLSFSPLLCCYYT